VIGEISLVLIARKSTESRFDFNDLRSREKGEWCGFGSYMFYRIGYVLSDYSQGQKTQGTIREASTLKSMESDLQLQDLPPGASNGGAVMALLMLN
jgi:hypothetical protein